MERGLCLRPSEPLLSIDVQSIRRLLGIFRNGSYDKSLFVVYSSNEVCNILQFQNLRRLLLLFVGRHAVAVHYPILSTGEPDVKSAASDNSNLTTVLVVGESAASKKIDHMSEFLWKCCMTIECLQRGIKQICGLCKMVNGGHCHKICWILYSGKACRSRMSIKLFVLTFCVINYWY
ncbi:unnamed protein product [Rhizophagus irregularis]|nr:unnamed protein product [Rhizophagus irregularis]